MFVYTSIIDAAIITFRHGFISDKQALTIATDAVNETIDSSDSTFKPKLRIGHEIRKSGTLFNKRLDNLMTNLRRLNLDLEKPKEINALISTIEQNKRPVPKVGYAHRDYVNNDWMCKNF